MPGTIVIESTGEGHTEVWWVVLMAGDTEVARIPTGTDPMAAEWMKDRIEAWR